MFSVIKCPYTRYTSMSFLASHFLWSNFGYYPIWVLSQVVLIVFVFMCMFRTLSSSPVERRRKRTSCYVDLSPGAVACRLQYYKSLCSVCSYFQHTIPSMSIRVHVWAKNYIYNIRANLTKNSTSDCCIYGAFLCKVHGINTIVQSLIKYGPK